MGLKSFLRRWLGIEPAQTTVKKTVGRAYQRPIPIPVKSNLLKINPVIDFYNKCGGYETLRVVESVNKKSDWVWVSTHGRDWRIIVKTTADISSGNYRKTKVFVNANEANSFKRKFLAHHERMKAKAAKGGLNYN